jgi:hypothetical protein
MTELSDRVKAFLGLPPVEWAEHIEALGEAEKQALADDLGSVATWAAHAHAYADARAEGFPHFRGVQAANKMLTGLRNLMGYSYPDRANFTF